MDDQDLPKVEKVQESEEENKSKQYQYVRQSVKRIVNYFIGVSISVAAVFLVMYWVVGYIDSDYWIALLILFPIALVIKIISEYSNYNHYHIQNKD